MRLIAAVLLAGSSLTLAACGGSADKADEPEATATSAGVDAAVSDDAAPLPTESASPSPLPSESATPTPTPTSSAAAVAAPAAPREVAAAAPATPPAAYNQCKVCHSVDKGEHGLGPSLAGIFGTKAGEVSGFNFSDAMKNSGLTWNEANLDKFLEAPQATVPGTKMAFAGVKDDARRKALVDYLKTL